MFKTRVTETLGIEYPIICGGMQWLGRAELIAAVSNAGGLGILVSAAFPTAEELRQEIRRTKELTDKPIGVNISLFPSAQPLAIMDYARVCVEEGVALVETSGFRAPTDLAPIFKEGGVKLMHKCTMVRHAQAAERAGADMVAVFGNEGGGAVGRGEIATPILVQRTVESVSIPVLAAGGISNARGFLAALAWGAEGVIMGTRFMITQECLAHPAFKEALVQADETQTIVLQRNIGNEHRMYKSETALKVAELEAKGAGLQELMPYIGGANARRMLETGDIDAGIVSCGQGIGLIHDIPTVKEVIDGIISGARELLGQLAQVAAA